MIFAPTCPMIPAMSQPRPLFSYRKYWAHRFGTGAVPADEPRRDGRAGLGCLRHRAGHRRRLCRPSQLRHGDHRPAAGGAGLPGRHHRPARLAASAEPFTALGRPDLFFGVTAGNMDSMVNRYTADRRLRHDDSLYARAARAAGGRTARSSSMPSAAARPTADVPIVLGGIEARCAGIAHYDYWSDKVRRSVLVDGKADMLLYGNAERAVVEVAHRVAKGAEAGRHRRHARRRAAARRRARGLDRDPTPPISTSGDEGARGIAPDTDRRPPAGLRAGAARPGAVCPASRVLHRESNPGNARALVQRHGDRELWVTPPPIPLTTPRWMRSTTCPMPARRIPSYGDAKIPAWEMIRFSVTIMRGCFGGCTFCSITEHEGRIIQSRSEASILREIEAIRDKTPGFTGIISDLGGPTANMYRMACKDKEIEARLPAARPASIPDICKNLDTDHDAADPALPQGARHAGRSRRSCIASGVRYDLAVKSPAYVKELVTHHVGGYLKIAPEHTEPGPLAKMMKPGIGAYDRFKAAVRPGGQARPARNTT